MPRPTTLPSPIAARSRTWAWSPTTAPAPIRAPATTTAPAQTRRPGRRSRRRRRLARGARARAERERLAEHAPSWTAPRRRPPCRCGSRRSPPSSTSSRRAPRPRPSSRPGARSDGSQHASSPRATAAAPRARARRAARSGPRARLARLSRDALDEVAALDPQRLLVRDPRAHDVARARDVLAVGGEVLVEALVVDRHLSLDLHVVEGRHPLRPDDREAAAPCAGRATTG